MIGMYTGNFGDTQTLPSSLSETWQSIAESVSDQLRLSRDPAKWSAEHRQRLHAILRAGLRLWARSPARFRHVWHCLKPFRTISIGPLVVMAPLGTWTVTGVPGGSTTTVTQADSGPSAFTEAMVGANLVVTGVGTYPIASYVSPTSVVVTGVATFSGKTAQVETASDGDYVLPADFGHMIGDVYFPPDKGYAPLKKRAPGYVWRRRATQVGNGLPEFYATSYREVSGHTGQQQVLMTWPTPSEDWLMRYQCLVNTQAITFDRPWPWGGAQHADLVLLACMAVAERDYLDNAAGAKQRAFDQAVEEQVHIERTAGAAEYFGLATDAGAVEADYSEAVDSFRADYARGAVAT
jgi:hypothetical protein